MKPALGQHCTALLGPVPFDDLGLGQRPSLQCAALPAMKFCFMGSGKWDEQQCTCAEYALHIAHIACWWDADQDSAGLLRQHGGLYVASQSAAFPMLASSLHVLPLQGDSAAVALSVTAGRLAVPAAVQWQLQSMTGDADAWLPEADQTGLLQWDGGAVAYIEVGLISCCKLCASLRLQSTLQEPGLWSPLHLSIRACCHRIEELYLNW